MLMQYKRGRIGLQSNPATEHQRKDFAPCLSERLSVPIRFDNIFPTILKPGSFPETEGDTEQYAQKDTANSISAGASMRSIGLRGCMSTGNTHRKILTISTATRRIIVFLICGSPHDPKIYKIAGNVSLIGRVARAFIGTSKSSFGMRKSKSKKGAFISGCSKTSTKPMRLIARLQGAIMASSAISDDRSLTPTVEGAGK